MIAVVGDVGLDLFESPAGEERRGAADERDAPSIGKAPATATIACSAMPTLTSRSGTPSGRRSDWRIQRCRCRPRRSAHLLLPSRRAFRANAWRQSKRGRQRVRSSCQLRERKDDLFGGRHLVVPFHPILD